MNYKHFSNIFRKVIFNSLKMLPKLLLIFISIVILHSNVNSISMERHHIIRIKNLLNLISKCTENNPVYDTILNESKIIIKSIEKKDRSAKDYMKIASDTYEINSDFLNIIRASVAHDVANVYPIMEFINEKIEYGELRIKFYSFLRDILTEKICVLGRKLVDELKSNLTKMQTTS